MEQKQQKNAGSGLEDCLEEWDVEQMCSMEDALDFLDQYFYAINVELHRWLLDVKKKEDAQQFEQRVVQICSMEFGELCEEVSNLAVQAGNCWRFYLFKIFSFKLISQERRNWKAHHSHALRMVQACQGLPVLPIRPRVMPRVCESVLPSESRQFLRILKLVTLLLSQIQSSDWKMPQVRQLFQDTLAKGHVRHPVSYTLKELQTDILDPVVEDIKEGARPAQCAQ